MLFGFLEARFSFRLAVNRVSLSLPILDRLGLSSLEVFVAERHQVVVFQVLRDVDNAVQRQQVLFEVLGRRLGL